MLIAATGIYGMLSYHVTERTSEIGIRMALGAQRRNVLLFIVGDGMKLAAIGTGIGLAGAIVLTKLMSTMLFGIAGISTGALTFAAVSVGALAVAYLRATSQRGAPRRWIHWLRYVTNDDDLNCSLQ